MIEACPRLKCLECGGNLRAEEVSSFVYLMTCVDCGASFIKEVR